MTGTGDNVGGLIGYYSGNNAKGPIPSIFSSLYSMDTYYDNAITPHIQNCSATGNVSGLGNNVGGFIGKFYSYEYSNYDYPFKEIIANCYAEGNVTGNNYVASLYVFALDWEPHHLTYCF